MTDLFAAGNTPYLVALMVMLGLTLVELIGLLTGMSMNDLVEDWIIPHAGLEGASHAQTGMETTSAEVQGMLGRFLAWLYIGKVPVLMVLIILLSAFGVIGLLLQSLMRTLLGSTLPNLLAIPVVLMAALPVVRTCTAALARWMPRDETNAVDPASFIGHTARILTGIARPGMPAEARLTDRFGTDHHVLVEPEDPNDTFAAGSTVLLVRQSGGGRFTAIANPNDRLIDQE